MKGLPARIVLGCLLMAVAACGSDDDTSAAVRATVATLDEGVTDPTDTTAAVSGTVIELVIVEGKVEGGVGRHDVRLGDTVVIRVISDVAEELHVHGYDDKLELTAGAPAELTFVADIPGVFEVELEQSGLKVAELQVA